MKRKAARVVPELLERGVKARSREGLRGVAQSRAGDALDKLAKLESQLPKGTTVKTRPVLEALERAKQRATGATVEVGSGKPLLYGEKGNVIARGPGKKKAIGNEAAIANY